MSQKGIVSTIILEHFGYFFFQAIEMAKHFTSFLR